MSTTTWTRRVTERLYPTAFVIAVILMAVSFSAGILRSLQVHYQLPKVSFEYWGEVASEFERQGPAIVIPQFRMAAAIDLTRPDPYLKLWHVAKQAEDEENMIFALRGLVRLYPNDPRIAPSRVQLASLLLKYGKVDEADHHSRTAVRLIPDDDTAQLVRAAVIQQIGSKPDTEER